VVDDEAPQYGETLPDGRPYHAGFRDRPEDVVMLVLIAVIMVAVVAGSMVYGYNHG